MRIKTALGTFAVFTLAACSSGATVPTRHGSSSAPRYVPTAGDDAATIASHIPDCQSPRTESVGKGGPAMLSAASCTLDGHLVIIDTWQTGEDVISPQLTPGETVYYAHGAGWTAFLAEQGATATTSTLQMQLTNDAGGLLQQGFNSDALTPVPPATQRELVGRIASALAGSVGTS